MTALEFQQAISKVTTPLPGSVPKPIVYRLSVKQKYNGLNIIDFYCQAIPSVPRSQWVEKVVTGNMTVDDQTVAVDFVVKTGQVTQHSTAPVVEPTVNAAITLVYEDESVLVLNKPAPLPMHPCGRFSRNSLMEILQLAFPELSLKIIHRIDSNTTGLVVFGKSKKVTQLIAKQFELQQVNKEYLALVEGQVKSPKFSSVLSIGKDKTKSGGRKVDEIGDCASTDFEVLQRNNETTLLKVIPHSGRTNQIRLHLAEIGHPIVGDHGYKDPTYFENHPLTYPDDCLCLHAWKLSFVHPVTKQCVVFEAEKPSKFV